MNNYVKVEDVQKLFDELLPYEREEFLVDNLWKNKLVDVVIEAMIQRYDKDEILQRYYTETELRKYLQQYD